MAGIEIEPMASRQLAPARPPIVEARRAACRFLEESLPEVHKVNVTRLAPLDSGGAVWEAEVVVWQPNATIEALGLRTRRPVFDQTVYVVHLDGQLNVVEYEVKHAE